MWVEAMKFGVSRRSIARAGGVACCLALIGSHTAAQARDNGDVGDLFARAFGFDSEPQRPTYYESDAPPVDEADRPLIVRPRHRSRPRIAKAPVPHGPVAPVSIYEDRTLRRGDAVMTAQGIRIFMGGDSLPYRPDDFVAVSEANGLSKPVQKALVAIDRVPRI